MKRPLAFLLAIFLTATLFACAPAAPAATPAPTPRPSIDIADLTGSVVSFAEPPKRVIALDPSHCEIIYALGAQDALVAVGSYCDYPPETGALQKVGSYSKMSVEEIIALAPDCLVMSNMATDEAQAAAIKNAKIPVVVLNAKTIEDTYMDIGKIGLLLGKEKEAAEIVAGMKKRLDDIRAASAGGKTVKVYYEVAPLSSGPWSCGSQTFQHELIELAGGENIFADLTGWSKVSEEQIIARDPDVIITSLHAAQTEDPTDEIRSRKGWEVISAVRNGQLYAVDANTVSRSAPRLVEGAANLRGCIESAAK